MAAREKDGRFKKGARSPNPKGRTPDTGAAAQIRAAITQRAPEIIKVIIDDALAGDIQAGLALLNKISPNLKSASEPVQFDIDTSKGLSGTGEHILQSISNGDIALDSGTQLLSSLAALAKMKEVDEIINRLEKLEAKHEQSH